MEEASLLTAEILGKPMWIWLVFIGLVFSLLALDLGVLNRKSREITATHSFFMSVFYIAMACAFGGWVWWELGNESGIAWYTGFLSKKPWRWTTSLSSA